MTPLHPILQRLNIVASFAKWKFFVEKSLKDVHLLQEDMKDLQEKHRDLETKHNLLREAVRGLTTDGVYSVDSLTHRDFPGAGCVFARRGRCLRILSLSDGASPSSAIVGSRSADSVVDAITRKEIDTIEHAVLLADGTLSPWRSLPGFLEKIINAPSFYKALLSLIEREPAIALGDMDRVDFFRSASSILLEHPCFIDFLAAAQAILLPDLALTASGLPLPFDDTASLPSFSVAAEPRRKSALFIHNSYYHFNTLAKALQRRGWDALTVSVESPDSPHQRFYVGEDINFYHPDAEVRNRQIREFLQTVPERFGSIHFYGQGRASLFGENFDGEQMNARIPWDFYELRRHRLAIGYMPSGCLDGARQSSIRRISGNVCGRCVWERRPDICNDIRNSAWGEKLERICDWVGLEGDWAVDERCGPKFVRGPVVTTLDPDYWHPDIPVEPTKLVPRNPGEILVYHAVGNMESRRKDGRDIKGSGAVEKAIATLQAEGIRLKLFFATNIPISEVREYKVQADIVVDQLNYGRIGANARESFMMGKPVVTRLVPQQEAPIAPLRSVAEAPALNASEETIEHVLRVLSKDPERRRKMARASRAYALRWFGDDACALRYETIIDRIHAGLVPETDDLYPSRENSVTDDLKIVSETYSGH